MAKLTITRLSQDEVARGRVPAVRMSSGCIEVYAEPKSLPAGTACQRDNLMVRELEIFSHGGLDGPILGDNRRQFGLSRAPPLSALPRLPYTGDAILFFHGCRIGAGQFLGTFAGQQGVATYGFEGTTSFSTRPESFYVWSRGALAYQLEFPGSETISQLIDRHPRATLPKSFVPRREIFQRKVQTSWVAYPGCRHRMC